MYDVIGDSHGHAGALIALLEQLGYCRHRGLYSHPNRKAVFIGDFIDRGPRIADVLNIVRPMIDAGGAFAVMGNHEFNAIAYHTHDPADGTRFLREHNEKNNHQHAETMRQLSAGQLHEAIEWFRTLPMWLELDGIRVIHACWDPRSIAEIEASLDKQGSVNTAFMQTATQEASPLFVAVEDVLKGKELPLPDGLSFKDKDGHDRSEMRVKWFEDPVGKSFKQYALQTADDLPDEPVPDSASEKFMPYDATQPPIFIGHYSLRAERPTRLAANVACVDYSVAKGGSLCAYRWDGETVLSNDNFVWVDATGAIQGRC